MTALERTLKFIRNEPVDHPPFHPITMRWTALQMGVPYRDFCLDFKAKCKAVVDCATAFKMDWVTVMSDPYAEAEAFGLTVEYPEDDLPIETGGKLASLADSKALQPYVVDDHPRLLARIHEVEEFARLTNNSQFIVGWVEGPMAEYADIRGTTYAAMDLYDDPDAVHHAMDVIVNSAIPFITRQIEAGAHCIGIGDAFASQIGEPLYMEFVFEREKRLVDHIHSLGAMAKLHICGNTSGILPKMIATGANIIDVDHMVPSVTECVALLGDEQVFSGQADPVSTVQDGSFEDITNAVNSFWKQSNGRTIISAGCEIPPGASPEKVRHFQTLAATLAV